MNAKPSYRLLIHASVRGLGRCKILLAEPKYGMLCSSTPRSNITNQKPLVSTRTCSTFAAFAERSPPAEHDRGPITRFPLYQSVVRHPQGWRSLSLATYALNPSACGNSSLPSPMLSVNYGAKVQHFLSSPVINTSSYLAVFEILKHTSSEHTP